MSLDVYLVRRMSVSEDDGLTWEKEEQYVYDANITHNLGQMADKAGIYDALWFPYKLVAEYDASKESVCEAEQKYPKTLLPRAKDIIEVLEKGLADMKARPEYYSQFNSPNGWGMYEHFIPFIENYLEACKKYPNAVIEVSR